MYPGKGWVGDFLGSVMVVAGSRQTVLCFEKNHKGGAADMCIYLPLTQPPHARNTLRSVATCKLQRARTRTLRRPIRHDPPILPDPPDRRATRRVDGAQTAGCWVPVPAAGGGREERQTRDADGWQAGVL